QAILDRVKPVTINKGTSAGRSVRRAGPGAQREGGKSLARGLASLISTTRRGGKSRLYPQLSSARSPNPAANRFTSRHMRGRSSACQKTTGAHLLINSSHTPQTPSSLI